MNETPTPPKTYTNGEITVLWQANLCQHSEHCYKELSAVFELRVSPGRGGIFVVEEVGELRDVVP